MLYPLSYEGVRRAYLGLPSSSLPPSTCCGTYGGVHPIGQVVESVREQVAVEVQGHRGRVVPQHHLHHLRISSGRDRQRRRSVPQLVRVEASAAARSREQQIVRCSSFGEGREFSGDEPRQRHGPARMGLGVLGVPHTSRPEPDGIEMPRSKRHDDKTIVVWQSEPLPIN